MPGVGHFGCLTLSKMESYLKSIHDQFQAFTMADLVAVVSKNRVIVVAVLAVEKVNINL
jgi:hypothetical protein